MSRNCFQRLAAFLVVLACPISQLAHAKTIDRNPCPTILLTTSNQFIAQDAWNSVALYGFDSDKVIRRFPAGSRVNRIEATSDEQHFASRMRGRRNRGLEYQYWRETLVAHVVSKRP